MESEIVQLSSDVIDQIAAGEVVERPAHMVKELVENAIDAGASEVQIFVDEGGRRVRVEDDGQGIPREQLKLALSRHATSKIRKASDLWALSSFGFRGEALASVASVSELQMVSKYGEEPSFRIQSHFGRLSEVEEVGGKKGTTVDVSHLFDNVPARKKFLKTDSGEQGQIKNTLKALGLSHPQVGFRLKVGGKLVHFWPKGQTELERAQQVLAVEGLFVAEGEHDGYRAKIVFAPPNQVFGNSRNIWLFAQGRWVQDRSLQAAVTEAYRGLLMHGEFPYAVVWLECRPEDIDVNIHPTKSQVKFKEPRSAFRAVQRTLRAALEGAPWVEKLLQKQKAKEERPLAFSGDSFESVQYPTKRFVPNDHETGVEAAVTAYSSRPPKEEISFSRSMPAKAKSEVPASVGMWEGLHVIGQAHLTYIVAQSADKMIFVDQHAAHERVAYEKLMEAWKKGANEVQQHLIPLTLDFEEEQVEALMTVRQELAQLGLEIDQGGPTSILVRSSMTLIKDRSVAQALSRLAQEICEKGDSFAFEHAVSDVCATMACHSVIRAGQALSLEEMKALLRGMDEFPLSSFCPHGRPVFVEYPFDRLEKDFGRIV